MSDRALERHGGTRLQRLQSIINIYGTIFRRLSSYKYLFPDLLWSAISLYGKAICDLTYLIQAYMINDIQLALGLPQARDIEDLERFVKFIGGFEMHTLYLGHSCEDPILKVPLRGSLCPCRLFQIAVRECRINKKIARMLDRRSRGILQTSMKKYTGNLRMLCDGPYEPGEPFQYGLTLQEALDTDELKQLGRKEALQNSLADFCKIKHELESGMYDCDADVEKPYSFDERDADEVLETIMEELANNWVSRSLNEEVYKCCDLKPFQPPQTGFVEDDEINDSD